MKDEALERAAQQERVQELTDKLEAGMKTLFESDEYKKYLEMQSHLHKYSASNCLLIALQKPDASMVAGYHAWHRYFDRHVVTGEKAIYILAPSPYTVEQMMPVKDMNGHYVRDEDGNTVKESQTVVIQAFKPIPVFDVSQTDGKPLPTLGVSELDGKVENFEQIRDALLDISPCPISYETLQGGIKGYFSSLQNRIVINAGMSELQEIKTLVHEISHATTDALTSDRDDVPADRRSAEVRAESVAFCVSSALGLDTSEYSFGYIAGWSSDKSMKELKQMLESIRTTSGSLIEKLEDRLIPEKKIIEEKKAEIAKRAEEKQQRARAR